MSDTPPAPIDYETPRTATDVSAVAVGTIGLALLGLNLLVNTSTSLPFVVNLLIEPRTYPGYPAVSTAIVVGAQLALAIVLVLFARPIAGRLFGRLSSTPLDVGPSAWMTIVVAGCGLLLLLLSLEEGIRGAVAFAMRINANLGIGMPSPVSAGELLTLFVPFAKVGVALLLFLRPRGVVALWTRHARV